MNDTFMSLFPQYGVSPDKNQTQVMGTFKYEEWNPIEQRKMIDVPRDNFFKLDETKRYTEELLKTTNMRGKR